jgi:hypothetical protein
MLIEKLVLDNGLTLEFWDRSGKDRWGLWTVRLLVKSDISVREEYFNDVVDGAKRYKEAITCFGDVMTYTYEKTRTHVLEKDRAAIFKVITDRFKSVGMKYLSGEDFPKKFVLKEIWFIQRSHVTSGWSSRLV